MSWTSKHLKWLCDTGKRLRTPDGKDVEIWEFKHNNDDAVFSAWAKHFRNHYCFDTEIDILRCGTGYSRSEYLTNIKLPDSSVAPGPSIRAGDFGEILVADYLQYILGYSVPRRRYAEKSVRNESTKGCDIIGFKYFHNGMDEKDDVLAIFEAKTQFSGTIANPRLQDAVNDSTKDQIRKAESLNAIKQHYVKQNLIDDVEKIARFQNLEDRPYREIYGAVALFSTQVLNETKIAETKTKHHPHAKELVLLVFHGNDMMTLVHELYRRVADEA
ncbi:MAG: DUF1837 domain-containing protein [Nanoarchaeota archaeon]|nr:DUF1837 domain-containing protein [Nanoarchaeota archaeon]